MNGLSSRSFTYLKNFTFSRREDGEPVTQKRALEILAEELTPLAASGYAPRPDVETAALKASRRILTELGGI